MRLTNLRLSSFKCFDEAAIEVDRGVTVVNGHNGSGKTTLLQAAFFALYGARSLDRTLDAVVTRGADDAEVECTFEHQGERYRIERRVRRGPERATTARCVLEGPKGSVDGARAVRRRVSEIVGMDGEAFVNCAYVQQGDVNALIEATPDERQDVIDGLLQLGALETYRDRASDARVGVGRVRDDIAGALTQVDEQIAEKEDRNLQQRRNEVESEIASLAQEREELTDKRETALEAREAATAVIEEFEEKREDLTELDDEIDELEAAIDETASEREELATAIGDCEDALSTHRREIAELAADTDIGPDEPGAVDPEGIAVTDVEDRVAALEDEDEDLQERIREASVAATRADSEAQSHREAAEDARERASERRERAEELADEIADLESDVETLRERREEVVTEREGVGELLGAAPFPDDEDALQQVRDALSTHRDRVRQRVAELDTRVAGQRRAVADAERLRARGRCPECGQDVAGAPHVAGIGGQRRRLAVLERERERARDRRRLVDAWHDRAGTLLERAAERSHLDERRERIDERLEERRDAVTDRRERREAALEDAEAAENEARDHREHAEECAEQAQTHRETVSEADERREAIASAIERLDQLADERDALAEAREERERHRERRKELGDVLAERRDRLAALRERREELAAAVDEDRLAAAREQRDEAQAYLEKVDDRREELADRRSELQSRLGAIENELEALADLRERRDHLADRRERLDSLYAEVEELGGIYGRLRAELRQRNVAVLERMLNETFDLVAGGEAYARIELDGDYGLTVHEKGGETLDPGQLSGGERALFNLSLRAAIYRLLAEGVDGAPPMPPLIFDEPTVFLDDDHVSRLVDLVEFMRTDVGVEQILVVSHDEELVGAADDLIRVAKDPTTNRSRVTQERGADLDGLLAAADGDES